MKHAEIAKRYASALFDLGAENNAQEKYLAELKKVNEVFESDSALKTFTVSPTISATQKQKVVQTALANAGLSKETESLVLLLAERERLSILAEIVSAYEARADKNKGVTRGIVRSGAALSDGEKSEMQNAIAQSLNKKVELEFVEDKAILGGVVAKVGSLTFDDSLSSHLRRIEENLNRSVN